MTSVSKAGRPDQQWVKREAARLPDAVARRAWWATLGDGLAPVRASFAQRQHTLVPFAPFLSLSVQDYT